ncbi:transcriptional regulator [Bradyrhizobium elkanii]
MPAWSAADEQRLLQLVRETGLTQREIAQKLGRTEAAVSGRLILIRKRAAERED